MRAWAQAGKGVSRRRMMKDGGRGSGEVRFKHIFCQEKRAAPGVVTKKLRFKQASGVVERRRCTRTEQAVGGKW